MTDLTKIDAWHPIETIPEIDDLPDDVISIDFFSKNGERIAAFPDISWYSTRNEYDGNLFAVDPEEMSHWRPVIGPDQSHLSFKDTINHPKQFGIDESLKIKRLTKERDKAMRALIRAGFQDFGGEEWKPPIGPETAAWLIEWQDSDGAKRDVSLHNAILDYRDHINPNATVCELIRRPI